MMRRTILMFVGVCFLSASAGAAVTFTQVFDVITDVGALAFGNVYNPGDDTFLSVPDGQQIVALSGTDGSLTGISYNMTGVDLSGLGLFAVGAGPDGVVYGVPWNSLILHRWASPAVPPTTAATGLQLTRNMTVHGSGTETIVATAGGEDFGPIHVYGTTDGQHFSLIDSVTGIADYGHTIDKELSMAWGTPWVSEPIIKKVKVDGAWVVDPQWSPDPISDEAGPLWYDEINGILLGTTHTPDILFALDARTGALLGSVSLIDDEFWLPTSNGAYAEPYPGGGTFWFAQRGLDNTVHVGKFTYSVSVEPRGPASLYLLDGFGTVQMIGE